MESYSTQAVLSVADRGFTSKMRGAVKTMEQLEDRSNRASSSIMNIAKGVGAFKVLAAAGDTLKNSLSGAIDRFDTINKFPKIMRQMGFSAEEADASISKLSDGIQGLPTTLDGIVSSAQHIAVLTKNLDKATDTSLALNDAFLASGASTADASRGLTQYVQMLSKGTVDMQSWRTLQETMGPALYEVAEAFGYAGESAQNDLYDALQSGAITFSQLNDKLIELDNGVNGFAERARTASGGVKTSFQNMGTSVVRGVESVVREVDNSMTEAGLPNLQQALDSAKVKIDEFFKDAADGAGTLVGVAAPAVKFVSGNIEALGVSLGVGAAGFVAFRTAAKIQDVQAQMKAVKPVIDAVKNSTELSAAAMVAREKAERAMMVADKLSAKSIRASEAAIKAEEAALKLSTTATRTKTTAQKTAKAESAIYKEEERAAAMAVTARSREESAAAAALKVKAAEDELASAIAQKNGKIEKKVEVLTKARATAEKKAEAAVKAKKRADEAATVVEKKKAAAAKSGAASEELNTVAEMQGVAAAKAKSNADRLSAVAEEKSAAAKRADTIATKLNTEAEVANAAATEASQKAAAVSSTAVAVKTGLLGVLSGELGLVAAAQMVWNTAMAANPIGTVIVATTALIGLFAGVTTALAKMDTEGQKSKKETEELIKSIDELNNSLDESERAHEEAIDKINDHAYANRKLLTRIEEVSRKENKSAEDVADLKSNIDALNASMEGLNLQYSETTGQLNMSTEAIQKQIDAVKGQSEAEENLRRYNETLVEQSENERSLSELKEKRAKVEEECATKMELSDLAGLSYIGTLNDMDKREADLINRKQELVEKEKYLSGILAESQSVQAEATAASTEAQKISWESLSDTQKSVAEEMKSTYQSLAEQATNMFDVISTESELSVAEMTANLQQNQQIISDWANNIEALANRGVNEGLLEQLRQAGPESAGYVNAMVLASDAELQQLSTAFQNGGESAKTAFQTAFELTEVPQGVMDLVTKTEESLRAQVEAADFSSISRDAVSGYTDGFKDTSAPDAAAGQMGTNSADATRTAIDSHSPSRVFESIGEDAISGYILGVQGKSAELNAAMTTVMAASTQAAMNSINIVLNNVEGIATSGFDKIPAAAQVGMNRTAQTVSIGMSNSNSAMLSGMNQLKGTTVRGMNTVYVSVKTIMQKIPADARLGMGKFVKEIDSGMDQSKASVSRGKTGIISELMQLREEFYRSGYFASIGLANGINAGAGAAITAARTLANQVAETMNKALDVGSPSRVTRKIGEFTTEGFVIGILDDIKNVRCAAADIAESAVPDFARAGYPYAFDGFGDINMHYLYEPNDENKIVKELRGIKDSLEARTYVFESHFDVDGREFVKSTAQYTEEELKKRNKVRDLIKGIR